MGSKYPFPHMLDAVGSAHYYFIHVLLLIIINIFIIIIAIIILIFIFTSITRSQARDASPPLHRCRAGARTAPQRAVRFHIRSPAAHREGEIHGLNTYQRKLYDRGVDK